MYQIPYYLVAWMINRRVNNTIYYASEKIYKKTYMFNLTYSPSSTNVKLTHLFPRSNLYSSLLFPLPLLNSLLPLK